MIDIHGLLDEQTKKELLQMMCSEANDGDIYVEIGAFTGCSICYVGQTLKELEKKLKIYVIDNWKCENVTKNFWEECGVADGRFYEKFIENVTKVGIKEDLNILKMDSIEASKLFDNESISYMFIDGCHEYEYVRNELIAWIPKVKVGGIISGHDAIYPDVCKATEQIFGKRNLISNHASYWVRKEKSLNVNGNSV